MNRILQLYLTVAGALGIIISSEGQQLPQFSQYLFNTLHVNPAYAGYKGEGYIQSTFRDQWSGFPGAPRTMTLMADFSANEGTMGFAGSVLNDRIGATDFTSAMFTYSYRVLVGYESFLSLGLSAGFSQYSIDPSRLNPADQGDLLLPDSRVNLMAPNINAGLFFHNEVFFAGLSAYNLAGRNLLRREDLSLGFHDFQYFFISGFIAPLSYDIDIKPSILVKYVDGAPINYDINAMFLFREFLWLGGSLRSNWGDWRGNLSNDLTKRNAVAFIMELFIDESFRIGYSYDHNLNVLENFRNGSHEISLGYYLFQKRKVFRNSRWL
ncbi:type IX secretion system membrane protein PorP/SprF [Cecembia sp.]|uniref:PorP/SprF family type IX secretion system membrane protein n=1 Tax=Cecembia sp. TaxID=1898110 RepID=UPI0025B82956|nr:type IX secretion system membrane protein PorP/SprF [Cecembia sp.]